MKPILSMKVKDKYTVSNAGNWFHRTTLELIIYGANDREGKVEALEAQVEQLTRIVAELIDRANLSNEEKLKITNCEWKYDIVDDIDIPTDLVINN